jgi:hypothetical protein
MVWLTALFVLLPAGVSGQDVAHDREQAATLLEEMVGTWEIQRDDAPVGVSSVYGLRTIRAGLDEITLEWEEVQATGTESRGFLGYDPAAGSYYMVGVHGSPNLRVSFLTGTPQGDGNEIRWEPVGVTDTALSAGQLITSILRVEEPGGMVWRAYDNGWVFNLVRL